MNMDMLKCLLFHSRIVVILVTLLPIHGLCTDIDFENRDNIEVIRRYSTVIADYGDITVYESPDTNATKVGIVANGTEATIVDAVSIVTYFKGLSYDLDELREGYATWFEIRNETITGWITYNPEYIVFARFSEPYSSLREGPSFDAPIVKAVRPYYRDYWSTKPNVEAGQVYFLKGICNDWYCVGDSTGGGWLPASTSGLELFVEIKELPDLVIDDNELTFFIQLSDNVKWLVYRESLYVDIFYKSIKNPELTVSTQESKYYSNTPVKVSVVFTGHTIMNYYIYTFAEPMKISDIQKIRLTTLQRNDDSGERFAVSPDWYNIYDQ